MPELMRKTIIVKDKEIMGGSVRIEGTRIRVMDIVEKYTILGYSPEQIAEAFDISTSEVFQALSYYYEHPEEIRKDIKKQKDIIEKYRK